MNKIDSSSPLVSIVIVNWNGIEDTKLCLKHTSEQSYSNIEIVVVDNGSTDGSLNYLREHKGIKLVENHKNLGFSGGHIAGYNASKGEYILLLNNDAIMDSDYVKNAVRIMQADVAIGALGGRAYLWDEQNKLFDTTNEFHSYQNINMITAEGIFEKDDQGVMQEVNSVSGSCVLVRRSIIDEVGYLHDPFFAYYEETDLFARMKRSGYKIMYHPGLAIWHANAKSSSRKAPTFAYYMMMRNRFCFAVRNFDGWSLIRFLKFYLVMGIVSTLKSLLPTSKRPMHQAYGRAFFYNLVFGWKAFVERSRLRAKLGKSNYNQLIFREQNGISIVVEARSQTEIDYYNEFCSNLRPNDEIVVVVSKPELISKMSAFGKLDPQIRLCVDRGYFSTHPQNIGAVCSKSDWIALADDTLQKEQFSTFCDNLYFINRAKKKLAALTNGPAKFRSFKSVVYGKFAKHILINRSLLIDNGGLNRKISFDTAVREIISYSFIAKAFWPLTNSVVDPAIPDFSGNYHALHKILSARFHSAQHENKQPGPIDKLANKYYRIAQLVTLVTWLLSIRIPFRLKVGRIKNFVVALLTLKIKNAATQLKHMRNEVTIYHNSHDLVLMKKQEANKLNQLINQPTDTPIFIILRDRFEPLKQLLRWLEAQNLKKIIFIDNDSKLPPLVDFLKETNYQVLELRRNMAQKAPWSAGIIKVLLPDDFYVVTDPDIIPTLERKNVLRHFYELHKKFPNYLKVGFGLKIDDLPEQFALKNEVIKWESQFWKHKLEEGVYEAGVDTTFAVYKPYTYKYVLHPSIRVGEPYTARHLPWYSGKDDLTDEEVFYRLRADQSVSSWHRNHLPERYKKELSKQQR